MRHCVMVLCNYQVNNISSTNFIDRVYPLIVKSGIFIFKQKLYNYTIIGSNTTPMHFYKTILQF